MNPYREPSKPKSRRLREYFVDRKRWLNITPLTAVLAAVLIAGIAIAATPALRVNALDMPDGTGMALSATGHGVIKYDNASHAFQASTNGGAFTAIGGGGSSGPATYVLSFPDSPVTHVEHGAFWTVGSNITGPFFWEAWAKYTSTPETGYIVSEGYGGGHSLLFGYSGASSGITANIWNGTALTTYGCDETIAAGEWGDVAVAWDGTSYLYAYFDGVPCGRVAYAGVRQAQQGTLYVGGSDHSMFRGSLAAIRGFEGAFPYDYYQTAYRPDRFFGSVVYGKDFSANLAFLADYTHPESLIGDFGLYNGRPHPGRLASATLIDVYHTDVPLFSTPVPQWVADATCPVNPLNPPAPTAWGGPTQSPATPPGGAIAYDSFGRADQTFVNSTAPTLGSTEVGALTWQYATDAGVFTPSATNIYAGIPWGILHAKAVSLLGAGGFARNVAWVDLSALGAGHADMTVSLTRKIASYTDDLAYTNQAEDGLVFRWTDYQNFCYASWSGTWGCYSGGVLTAFTTWTHSTSDTILKVVATGTSLTVYSNGVSKATATSSLNQTATGAGMMIKHSFASQMSSLERYDDFTVN